MSPKFVSLPVKSVEKVTADCSVIEFDVSDEFADDFAFRHGQHLTLRAMIDGEDVRRSYSLCSSPLDNSWKVAVKRIEDGRFSTYANTALKAGDVLEVMPPSGHFFVEPEPDKQKNYVAFAAGSGITPIMSIVKTHLALEPKSTFQLFYTNQAVSTIILKEELEGLKNQYLDRLEIFHFFTQEDRNIPLFSGRIDTGKLDILFRNFIDQEAVDHYFLCGPNQMIFMIRDYLEKKGIDDKQVHFELFNTDGIAPKENGKKKKRTINPDLVTEVLIREGGKDFQFQMVRGSENLLDAALKKNADLPFACKGGVCCTCRARLLEGQVDVQVNYGLEQDEIDNGYILTCQSIPTSEKVVVDFDSSLGQH